MTILDAFKMFFIDRFKSNYSNGLHINPNGNKVYRVLVTFCDNRKLDYEFTTNYYLFANSK